MHVLTDAESLTVSAALMFFCVAAQDALAAIHGKAPLSEEERDELMAIADRLSMPAVSVDDAVKRLMAEEA